MKILHINLNHSAGAHDLLLQTIAEWKVCVAVVTEPYKMEDNKDGIGSLTKETMSRYSEMGMQPLRH